MTIKTPETVNELETKREAKRTIYIERPDGHIPGLLAVNEFLVEHFGVVVSATVQTADKRRLLWTGAELHTARIEGDNIIVGHIVEREA